MKIGLDAEVFLKSYKTAAPVSAVGLIGGTKEKPRPIYRGALQEDNVSAEFNIDPADNVKDFVRNIHTVMGQLSKKVNRLGLLVDISPVKLFPDDQLDSEQAQTFGCDPDYDAYSVTENPRPILGNVRTSAAHIHVDIPNVQHDPWACLTVAKAMDVAVGIPLLLLEDSGRRREYYGRAGAHRPKSYGIEWRVAGNEWLRDDKYIKMVYRQTARAVGSRDHIANIGQSYSVRDIINDHDTQKAWEMLEECSSIYPGLVELLG